jgi:hypothetical protein
MTTLFRRLWHKIFANPKKEHVAVLDGFLIQQNGDFILQQNGDKIYLRS